MILTVDKAKTLLIDGPARVHILTGKGSVLGALSETGDSIVVRKGKRTPFDALRNSKVELTLGDSASYSEIEGSSIPSSWGEAVNEILSSRKHRIVLVLGGVDCGKTSFCTYLINSALNSRQEVALIDGDLGQSDIGPPGTVSLSLVRQPFIDPFRLGPESLVFMGATSPSGMVNAVIDALETLKEEASESGADLVVVNTDGWVEGDGAVSYKVRLVEAIASDAVVAIQGGSEPVPMLDALADVKVIVVDSPGDVKKRDRETRKLLRESAYRKHLREAKVRSFPSSWVEIEVDLQLDSEEETGIAEERFSEGAIALSHGDMEGRLVALEDADGKVLGIGTIHSMDYMKQAMRIYTPVEGAVSKIRIGKIRLDKEGNEIGLIL